VPGIAQEPDPDLLKRWTVDQPRFARDSRSETQGGQHGQECHHPRAVRQGQTFDEYVKYAGSAENLAREAWGGYFPDGGSKAVARKDNSGSSASVTLGRA